MATGDVALQVVGVAFITTKETSNNHSVSAGNPTLQEVSGGGNVNEQYVTYVTVSHEAGGAYNRPELFAQLDPDKLYTVKFIEQ